MLFRCRNRHPLARDKFTLESLLLWNSFFEHGHFGTIEKHFWKHLLSAKNKGTTLKIVLSIYSTCHNYACTLEQARFEIVFFCFLTVAHATAPRALGASTTAQLALLAISLSKLKAKQISPPYIRLEWRRKCSHMQNCTHTWPYSNNSK